MSLTQRSTLDFQGAGVSAADSGGKTVVTIAGSSGPTARYISSNTTLVDADGDQIVYVDTSGGSVTVTFPASPTAGRRYIVQQRGGNFVVSNPNGNTMNGVPAATYNISTDQANASFVFDDTNDNWFVDATGNFPNPAPYWIPLQLQDKSGLNVTLQTYEAQNAFTLSTDTMTVNLPAVSGMNNGDWYELYSINTSTLDANGGDTINGAGTLALAAFQSCKIVADTSASRWLVLLGTT